MRPLTKSITWRLQFWHATILLFVVIGLSMAWFFQTRRAQMVEIDAELLSAARVLDGSLRGFRLPRVHSHASSAVLLTPSADRRLSLPRTTGDAESEISSLYMAIWLRDGQILKSEQLPTDCPTDFDRHLDGEAIRVTQRDSCREVRIVGPQGTQILVGRDISIDLEMLQSLALRIFGFSATILLIGLIGGWHLSRSVLRPIQTMSETARKFSVTDMSPRIDVVETESELGELATVLNDAFDRVQYSVEQRQQFAADASHELRTPLAVIQSQIELALNKKRPPDEYVHALTTCSNASERLAELVESLLMLARLDGSKRELEHSKVRLDRIALKCTDLMRPVALQAGVVLEPKTEAAWVTGDAYQLECVILNLIRNAITYNHREGSVYITVIVTDQVAELEIRDTGIGISAEHLNQVTERFYRVDKARSREHGGSGLGLSIAKQIIDVHQGTLTISSTTSQGTSVTVRLDSHQSYSDTP